LENVVAVAVTRTAALTVEARAMAEVMAVVRATALVMTAII
jgi:hypothetical protein